MIKRSIDFNRVEEFGEIGRLMEIACARCWVDDSVPIFISPSSRPDQHFCALHTLSLFFRSLASCSRHPSPAYDALVWGVNPANLEAPPGVLYGEICGNIGCNAARRALC